MEMEPQADGRIPDDAWFVIKETLGAGDFIGTDGVPTPMRDTDVAKMLKEAEKPEDTPSIKVEFEKGDIIKIRDGAFENFEGTVDSIDRVPHCVYPSLIPVFSGPLLSVWNPVPQWFSSAIRRIALSDSHGS